MNAALAADLIRRAVMITLMVSAPILVSALVVGLVVTLLQAITQLQEQTLTFLPKLLTMAVVFVLVLPWMLRELTEFVTLALRALPTAAG
jgi:flagellar biosynthetic protein FliQ